MYWTTKYTLIKVQIRMISEMARGFRVSVDWPLLRPLVSWEQYPSSCVTLGSQSQEKATKGDLLFSTCYQHVITVGEELCLAVIMYFNLSISQSIGRSVGRSIFLSVCGSVYITSPSLPPFIYLPFPMHPLIRVPPSFWRLLTFWWIPRERHWPCVPW